MPDAPYVIGECGVFLTMDLSQRCRHPVDPASGAWRMCGCCFEVFGADDEPEEGERSVQLRSAHHDGRPADG